jgi:hypothetical protein
MAAFGSGLARVKTELQSNDWMRQGLDDEFREILNDVLALYKPDGRVFPDVKAHVSAKGILITDVGGSLR